MKSVLEWYENTPAITSQNNQGHQSVPDIESELNNNIEKEQPEEQPEEQPTQEQDTVLMNEYKNCLHAIGTSEFLRHELTNYLAFTQVHDFDADKEAAMKKEQFKNQIKEVANELSKIISEL